MEGLKASDSSEVVVQESKVMEIQECDVRGAVVADKGEDAVLTSWAAEDLGNKGDNYMSVVKRVKARVTIEGREEQVTYVAKVKMLLSATFMEFSNLSFFKEHIFYTKLLPELNGVLAEAGLNPLRLPKFYHHRKSGEREIVILEDLTARDFLMADRKKGLDIPHMRLVLEELGKFHASSYLLQQKTPHEDLSERHKFLDIDWFNYCETARQGMMASITKELDMAAAVAESCKGYEKVARWLKEIQPRVFDIFEKDTKSRAPFQLVWHGDCWVNNFLFRYNAKGEPVDVMMLDLQSCQKGSLTADLLLLIYTSIPTQSRRHNLTLFLQEYLSSFSATATAGGLPSPFTLEELREEYNAKILFGILMGASFIPVLVGDAEDAPDYLQMDKDLETFYDERRKQVVDMLDRNPLLRERMCGLFDECIEKGILSPF
ncbi:uncharacterized protein LOC125044492 isoform X2 [Penaeus chinensis]|uniref:uncharacterized protein LOC125044492 isoform X1 n=1 Tax=Penaeus chinensis TaxID=139456 RepID=UPI001FB74E32|nr:uncharacterized protein LOC125044492 isoform X1 [Penaeus chinensis]XP_047497137.1 uncharacterized protein LOC125044492 isoform X2 [Penaeus chinensis]